MRYYSYHTHPQNGLQYHLIIFGLVTAALAHWFQGNAYQLLGVLGPLKYFIGGAEGTSDSTSWLLCFEMYYYYLTNFLCLHLHNISKRVFTVEICETVQSNIYSRSHCVQLDLLPVKYARDCNLVPLFFD